MKIQWKGCDSGRWQWGMRDGKPWGTSWEPWMQEVEGVGVRTPKRKAGQAKAQRKVRRKHTLKRKADREEALRMVAQRYVVATGKRRWEEHYQPGDRRKHAATQSAIHRVTVAVKGPGVWHKQQKRKREKADERHEQKWPWNAERVYLRRKRGRAHGVVVGDDAEGAEGGGDGSRKKQRREPVVTRDRIGTRHVMSTKRKCVMGP